MDLDVQQTAAESLIFFVVCTCAACFWSLSCLLLLMQPPRPSARKVLIFCLRLTLLQPPHHLPSLSPSPLAEDRKARDLIDTKNQADSMVYQTEKQLKEFGDKAGEEIKGKVEAKVAALKEAIPTDNLEKVGGLYGRGAGVKLTAAGLWSVVASHVHPFLLWLCLQHWQMLFSLALLPTARADPRPPPPPPPRF